MPKERQRNSPGQENVGQCQQRERHFPLHRIRIGCSCAFGKGLVGHGVSEADIAEKRAGNRDWVLELESGVLEGIWNP